MSSQSSGQFCLGGETQMLQPLAELRTKCVADISSSGNQILSTRGIIQCLTIFIYMWCYWHILCLFHLTFKAVLGPDFFHLFFLSLIVSLFLSRASACSLKVCFKPFSFTVTYRPGAVRANTINLYSNCSSRPPAQTGLCQQRGATHGTCRTNSRVVPFPRCSAGRGGGGVAAWG